MTEDKSQSDDGATTPSPEELRIRVEATREELGETVEALAAKADVKARAQEKTTAVKQQVAERTTHVTAQLRDRATHAAHAVQDRTPEPVREKAGQGMRAARDHRAPLLAVGVLVALLLVRRSRRHR